MASAKVIGNAGVQNKPTISERCQNALNTLKKAANDTFEYCKNPIQGNDNQIDKLRGRYQDNDAQVNPETGKLPPKKVARGWMISLSIGLLLGLQLLFKGIAYCGSKIAGVFQKQTGQNEAANGANGNETGSNHSTARQ